MFQYQNVLLFCCTRIQERLFVLSFRIGFYFNVSKRPFVLLYQNFELAFILMYVLSFCCTNVLSFCPEYKNVFSFCFSNGFYFNNVLLFCCTRIQKRLFVLSFRTGFYFNVSKRPFVLLYQNTKTSIRFVLSNRLLF